MAIRLLSQMPSWWWWWCWWWWCWWWWWWRWWWWWCQWWEWWWWWRRGWWRWSNLYWVLASYLKCHCGCTVVVFSVYVHCISLVLHWAFIVLCCTCTWICSELNCSVEMPSPSVGFSANCTMYNEHGHCGELYCSVEIPVRWLVIPSTVLYMNNVANFTLL